MTASVLFRVSGSLSLDIGGGSIYVANFDFRGKIRKPGIGNSMIYRHQNSRKSNFATEPVLGHSGLQTSYARPLFELTNRVSSDAVCVELPQNAAAILGVCIRGMFGICVKTGHKDTAED
jgi:hypothetical protein